MHMRVIGFKSFELYKFHEKIKSFNFLKFVHKIMQNFDVLFQLLQRTKYPKQFQISYIKYQHSLFNEIQRKRKGTGNCSSTY